MPKQLPLVTLKIPAPVIPLAIPIPPAPVPPTIFTRIKQALIPMAAELTSLGITTLFGFIYTAGLASIINLSPLPIGEANAQARSYLILNTAAMTTFGLISLVDNQRPYSLGNGMKYIARKVTTLSMFLFLYYQVFSIPPSEFHLPVMLGTQLLTPLVFDSLGFIKNLF